VTLDGKRYSVRITRNADADALNAIQFSLAIGVGMGVHGKLKWLVQGGKLPDDDSTLPRLLMAVYTPLSRCATASDACKLAAGYRLKQTGSCSQFPFCIFGLTKRCFHPRTAIKYRMRLKEAEE